MPQPNDQLTRAQAAAALTASGRPITLSTLATMATRGGGPPFTTFGGKAVYRWADLDAWAANRTRHRGQPAERAA